MAGRPAAGGGRWVEVDPERLPRWLTGFESRHGTPIETVSDGTVLLRAPDGASAELHPPPGVPTPTGVRDLVAQLGQPHRLGLLLARQAAVAVGIAVDGRLEVSKIDSSYVQGRTAAGGWSQHRFARRRGNQAKAAAGSASDIVARLLLPELDRLAVVVTGGDRRAIEAVLADPRLVRVAARCAPRVLDVGEPRLATLQQAAMRARDVLIRICEPPPAP